MQITVAESVNADDRAGYYDKSGALRDMVQNHIFQLMALVAMEPPAALDARSIRDEKVKVYKSVRHMRDVVELAHAGDPEVRRMIRDSGRHIGEVVASAVNLLNPKVIVVAGDLAGAYETFVAGLRETLYGNATAMATRELEIVPAAHGSHSGVAGTAAMVLDEVLSPRAVDALIG